jgi:hypothetical protein
VSSRVDSFDALGSNHLSSDGPLIYLSYFALQAILTQFRVDLIAMLLSNPECRARTSVREFLEKSDSVRNRHF